ncbi:MAG: hypothetical protein JNM56_28275 [Planctomycetia bacterium]|nr:hypothetical protein [Planctomycetia bacterium]
MSSRLLCRLWLPALLLALVAGRADAAETDKYLPDDTNGLISLNVRQVVDSPLFKKTYLPQLQQLLKSQADLQKQLQAVGFDPLRDIDRALLAFADSCERPGGKAEPGFVLIFKGRFDLVKLHAKAAELVPHLKGALKIQKSGNGVVYEIAGEERNFFFALPDRNTLVLAPRREPVGDALDRATGKKKLVLKSKEVQELITKTDGKQALWVVATGGTTVSFESVLAGPKGNKTEQMARKTLADSGVYEVSGGFWLTDNVKAAFGVKVQTTQAAKAVGDALQAELAKTIENGFDGKLDDPRFAPVREFLKEMVIAGDGKHIVIQSEVAGRVIVNSAK